MIKAVFVCSGNICRSPMAERVFIERARAARLPAFAVSMGTLGLVGQRAAQEAVKVAAARGVDVSDHRSQALNPAILRSATHIFAMEQDHVDQLVARGTPAERVHLLGRWDPTGGNDEIDDPIDQPFEVFETCFERIDRAISAFVDEQLALR